MGSRTRRLCLPGRSFTRRVRETPRDRDTPIVLVSTLGTEDDVRRGMEAGATAYILKPLSPHHIKTALRHLLEPAGPLHALAGRG